MNFPTITFTHKHVSPDHELNDLVTHKLMSLKKYLRGSKAARCTVEFERLPGHQSGPVCRLEVNLWRGDTLARAVAEDTTFLKAIDVVKQELEQELERARDKRYSLMRRGARQMKEWLRFGPQNA